MVPPKTHVTIQPEDRELQPQQSPASLEGDKPRNATAWAKTMDGQAYAACSTTQFGFKPVFNSTSINVEPPVTEIILPKKSPEEMQKDVEDHGWLTFKDEWILGYPLYRLHVIITIGDLSVDVGYSFLPFGTTFSITGLHSLAEALSYVTEEIWQDVGLDLFGLFISYTLAKVASFAGVAPGLVAIGLKGIAQGILFGLLMMSEKAGSVKMLAAFIANMFMGLIALSVGAAEAFAHLIWNLCTAPWVSAFMLATQGMIAAATPLEIIKSPVDYIESIVIDFPMAILAFTRYMGWC